MPIAKPIADAVVDQSLDLVVEAIRSLAETLARLARRGIGHRDIKPGNLYQYQNAWAVGDFGLVALPDGEGITHDNKRLGPEHYAAYEMVINPVSADPHPADVYSLGKTLWVLATKRRYPPGGHQRSDELGLRIADLRPDARANLLDDLVDRMTQLRPEARPSMEAVAAELGVWLRLRATPPVGGNRFDVTDLIEPFREKLRDEVEDESTEVEWLHLARVAAARLRELCAHLDDALRTLDARAQIARVDHNLTGPLHTPETLGSARVMDSDEHVSSLVSGSRDFPFACSYGWGLDLDETGVVTLQTVVYVGHERTAGSSYFWQGEPRKAEVGSIELAGMCEAAIVELRPQLRHALEIYQQGLS